MNKIILFICLFLLMSGIASGTPYQSGSFDPVRQDVDAWTCYDTAINYAREHPEWGVCMVSGNPVFRGVSHYVNWRIVDGELIILDMSNSPAIISYRFQDNTYARIGYDYRYTYYHIWDLDETPLRNYRVLRDNLRDYYTNQIE